MAEKDKECPQWSVVEQFIRESREYYTEGRKAMAKISTIHDSSTVWSEKIAHILEDIKNAIVNTLNEKDDRLVMQAQALAGDGRIPVKSHLITVLTICAFFGTLFIAGLMGMAYYTKTSLQAEMLGGRAEIKQHVSDAVLEVERKIEEQK